MRAYRRGGVVGTGLRGEVLRVLCVVRGRVVCQREGAHATKVITPLVTGGCPMSRPSMVMDVDVNGISNVSGDSGSGGDADCVRHKRGFSDYYSY